MLTYHSAILKLRHATDAHPYILLTIRWSGSLLRVFPREIKKTNL